MRLLIDTKDLELLVEKKRDYIGNQVTFDTWIAAVSFILSVLTAQYDQIGLLSGNQIKTFWVIFYPKIRDSRVLILIFSLVFVDSKSYINSFSHHL